MSREKRNILFVVLFMCALLTLFAERLPWDDQIIYFVMIDRFWNGDPLNDVQTPDGVEAGVENSKYNGGDLKGLIERLDYIKELGATAIWITPPVANQWWDGSVQYGGYHGYWARNFKAIDEHFGDLELYRDFIQAAHEKNIRVIQDIVVDHVGNYLIYDPVTLMGSVNEQSIPTKKPTQYPFDQNDYYDPAQSALNIYHWPSEIENPDRFNTALSDLDDLNTENPIVIEALKDSYGFWIDQGIDGFRIDTSIYVEDAFWPLFLEDPDGMYARASKNDKPDFLVYGEAWVTPQPYEDTGERVLSNYYDIGYNSMLDFPLMTELRRVFKEGKPTQMLEYRLQQRENYFSGKRLITFVDNHDMERFLKGVSMRDLKQALLVIMTIPGIPSIYYGTEQGFLETRATMFKEGFESGGVDHFRTDHELYQYLDKIIQLRKETPAFRYGRVTVVHSDPIGPGAFIYRVQDSNSTYFIFLNTSSQSRYATQMEMGVAEGTVLEPIFTEGIIFKNVVVGQNGLLNYLIAGKGLGVFRATDETQEVKGFDIDVAMTSIRENEMIREDFVLRGTSRNAARVRLYVDGSEREYATVVPDAEGHWDVPVRISEFISGAHRLFVRAYGKKATESVYSQTMTVFFDIPTVHLVEVTDPEGDDKGPTGDYGYPKDLTFEHQQDVLHVKLSQVGRMLRMDITMKNLTDVWSPTNLFDHVTFQIFFDRPDRTGALALPFQNATMPEGMDWDYMIYATGWSMALYESDEKSGPAYYGTPITPAPTVQVDKQLKTITLLVPLEVLKTDRLSGWKIYLTTYDYDGIEAVLRPISPGGGAWAFTGPSALAPKIMDFVLIDIP